MPSFSRSAAALLAAALLLTSCAAQENTKSPADSAAEIYENTPVPSGDRPVRGFADGEVSFLSADARLSDLPAADAVVRATDPLAGNGTVIAVIDTGFDLTHAAFTLPDGAEETIVRDGFTDLIYETNAASLAASAAGNTDVLADLYRTAKVPFAFDYAGRDTDVSGGNDAHGTHVAALAAAGGTDGTLVGAAPAAQILLMKVFTDDGETCRETDLMCAIEDAVRLGADVINLSLGTLSLSENSLAMERVARTIRYAQSEGVTVLCAAGNDGISGIGGLHSDTMRADNPDTALTSEPAILGETLAVGASVNAVTYAPSLIAGERKITYTTSLECEEGLVPSLTAALGGRDIPLVHVPGVGTADDFAKIDCAGKIALVCRGSISFEEKIDHAAKAGALGVIVYNTKDASAIIMTVGDASLPAVSVSYEDGVYLASLDGDTVRVPAAAEQFTVSDGAYGTADFSSRGPTSSLTLAPDLVAAGTDVLSAVPGGYGVMSGTSMASPQIAGLAASYIALYGDRLEKAQRADAVYAALMSAAAVLTDEAGVPISPRAQGAGCLTAGADVRTMHVTAVGADGITRISLGNDMLAGTDSFSFTVTVKNHGDSPETLLPALSVITEGAEEKDGVWYTTNASVPVPASISFDRESLTLAAGESATVTVTVTPDKEFLTEHAAVWTNGFFLEGFLTLSRADGTCKASIPYLGFCGDWNDAPMLDGGDWDGFESFYGGQLLYLRNDRGAVRPAGSDSSLFAFSPNGDGAGESVFFQVYPLRHISRLLVTVTDADGNTVYNGAVGSTSKTYVSDDGLTFAQIPLWDGTDGENGKYFFPDGQYEVHITLYSYSGGVQNMDIPLSIDTVLPTLSVRQEKDRLYAEANDGEMLYSLRIFLPNTDDSAVMENPFLIDEKITDTKESLTLTADIPAGTEYVYVRAEDCAGNVQTVRYYLDKTEESGR